MPIIDGRLGRRKRAYDQISARLAAMSDDDLVSHFARTATWRDHVLGNASCVTEIDTAKVFVKQIALTDLERMPENEGSTANLFDLPMFIHYGVGSPGFGAWRELKAYLRASDWVLTGECPYFPLVHHWRVLPRTPRGPLSPDRQAWLDRAPEYWGGSDTVRARFSATSTASASIYLFLEYVPEMLHNRLSGDPATQRGSQLLAAVQQLRDTAAFMNVQGMLHFDLNAHNVLTDNQQIYVTDFGLAICSEFDLNPDERSFMDAHRLYDQAYVIWDLVEHLERWSDTSSLPFQLKTLIDEGAPVAHLVGDFFRQLREGDKTAPYPGSRLETLLWPPHPQGSGA